MKKKNTSYRGASRFFTRTFLIVLSALPVLIIVAVIWRAMALMCYPDAGADSADPDFHFTRVAAVHKAENPFSGVNLGVRLKGLNGSDWGMELSRSDFDALCHGGFRYIRVPVQFRCYLDHGPEGYILDESMLERLDGILVNILDRGMIAIIDFHYLIPEDVYSFRDAEERQRTEDEFTAVWSIIAHRYRDFPPGLYFELVNEPRKPIYPDDWNRYVKTALAVIRNSGNNNLTRKVVVSNPILIGPLFKSWENVRGIDKLELPSPEEDPNILVTFHYYDPVPFTYQGQTYNRSLKRYSRFWNGNTWTNTGRQREMVRRDFDRIEQWAEEHGRTVILGEFGVSVYADGMSQVRWTELIRREAEARGMIWIFWQFFYEYTGDTLGGVYSQTGGFWRTEILDALQTRSLQNDSDLSCSESVDAESSRIDDYIAALYSQEWKIRDAAVLGLSKLRDFSPEVVRELSRLLTEDEEWHVRRRVAEAFLTHTAHPAALIGLLHALNDEEWHIRRVAAQAIGRMGPSAKDSLPALNRLLDDPEWQVRETALLSMVYIDPQAPSTVNAVTRMHNDPEKHIRTILDAVSRHPVFADLAD